MKQRLLLLIALAFVGVGLWTNDLMLAIEANDEILARQIRADIEEPISWELRCGNHYENGLQVCEMIRHGWQPIVAWDVEKWPVKRFSDKAMR